MGGRGDSNLREPGRSIVIVTTACLPWRTGTAVNPLLRAAYTAKLLPQAKVTLLVPWLAVSDQKQIFPDKLTFARPGEQGKWVKQWVEKRTGFEAKLTIAFYAARYDGVGFFSIFPVGDVTKAIPDEDVDVAILEEPEHLTWFHHGDRWTKKFNHVVGIMHTNYVDYIRRKMPPAAGAIYLVNKRMCSIHCHKVVKLSNAVQSLPRQTTCFCHGVPKAFLDVGKAMSPETSSPTPSGSSPALSARPSGNGSSDGSSFVKVDVAPEGSDQVRVGLHASNSDTSQASDSSQATGEKAEEAQEQKKEHFSKGAYFLGKGVWGKGYTELLELLKKHQERGGKPLPVDVYGSGEDMEEIKERAKKYQLDITFNSGVDHLDDTIHAYRVFVNPSTSDVVATTSAEALAMGKWVICAKHPSNDFFEENFRNALIYNTPEEFSEKLKHAETHDPNPLSDEELRKLTWEDATERFLDAASIKANEWPRGIGEVFNAFTWPVINAGVGIEAIRRAIGAGAHTSKTPEDLESFDPANRSIDYEYHLAMGYSPPRLL